MNKFNLNSLDNLSLHDIESEAEFIPLMTSEDEEALNKEALPQVVPILPLKNNVLFPGVVIPITAGRDKSIQLIKDANNSDKVIGVDRLVSIDLHTQQIQGFVDQPFDHLTAMPLFIDYFKEKVDGPISIISPDAGGVKRATIFAKHLEAYVGFVHKKRDPKVHNEVKSFTVIGEVEDRHAILLDDIIDTGGTIAAASRILKERGALSVNVAATHGIFSEGSVEKLHDAPVDKIVVTDTLLQNGNPDKIGNVEVLSVSPIIANALTSIFTDDSVSALFMGENVL